MAIPLDLQVSPKICRKAPPGTTRRFGYFGEEVPAARSSLTMFQWPEGNPLSQELENPMQMSEPPQTSGDPDRDINSVQYACEYASSYLHNQWG